MAAEGSIPGDVLSVSSDDEAGVSLKRPHEDSDDSSESGSHQEASRSPKRAKIQKLQEEQAEVSGSEDGEIDEDETARGAEARGSTNSEADTASGFPTNPQVRASMPSNPSLFRSGSITYKLPIHSKKKKGSWGARFKSWMEVFYKHNAQEGRDMTISLIQQAYIFYIDQFSGLKRAKKKTAKQSAKDLEDSGTMATLLQSLRSIGEPIPPRPVSDPTRFEAKVDERLPAADPANISLQPQTSPIAPQQPLPNHAETINGNAMANGSGVIVENDDLEQQRRYFPSAKDPSIMCLRCGREGHSAAKCAHAACQFCGAMDHWQFSCPSRSRCTKCRQLGHASTTCVEKLALTKEEGLACAFCASPDHLEEDCTEIWRSFHPDPESINTVSLLRPTCAECGSGDHYAADCEMRQKYSQNPTWSLRNRERYVDHSCADVSIEEAAVDSKGSRVTRGKELKIRGHASRTNNVHYSESDSEGEFLGAKANANKPRAQVGQIRVSSNIQMPKSVGNHARNQPPLPPGPPPSLPPHPHRPYGHQPPGLPSSLPAKPPAARDYRHVPPPPPQQGHGSQSWHGDQGGASHQGKGPGKARGGYGPRGGRGGSGSGSGRGRGGGGGRGRGRGRGGR